MLEKPIVNDVMKLIWQRGGWCTKIHGGGDDQRRGLPDIFACYRGWFLALEGKRPGEIVDPDGLQAEILAEIKNAKGNAIWFDSVDTVRALLDELDASYNDRLPTEEDSTAEFERRWALIDTRGPGPTPSGIWHNAVRWAIQYIKERENGKRGPRA